MTAPNRSARASLSARSSLASRRTALLLKLLLALLVATLGSPAFGQAGRPLEVGDLFRLRTVGDPQISPDGALVVYTVGHEDREADEGRSALWAVDVTSGERRRLTAPGTSASTPRFSPDGRRLAFLADRPTGEEEDGEDGDDPETQVWAFDLRGGDAQPLTAVRQGIEDFAWSPDGGRLALVIRDPEPEPAPGADDRDGDRPRPVVIDRLQFKRDYAGYLERRYTHLWVLDLDEHGAGGGELRQITSGQTDDSEPAWSPDGRLIAFTSNRTAEPDGNDNTDVFVVFADNTDLGATLRRITSNPGADASPAWSPNGRFLVHTSQVAPELLWYATVHLALSPAEPSSGGDTELLSTALDRNVAAPRFSADGSRIRFLLEDAGAQHLASVSADPRRGSPTTTSTASRDVGGEVAVTAYSESRDGKLAVLLSTADRPFEVFLAGGEPPRRLTRENDALLAELRLGEVRAYRATSRDGTTVPAFLTLPPGHDPRLRYPTILWIHGGPTAQYDWSFDLEPHLFAAHGYVVVRPNPRGSTGLGEDYCKAIFADWGNRDFDDVMAAVDWAIENGFADPERLGVGGWSYGGILTNYVITKTGRFAGAISGASEVLYVANYGHDHYQLQWETELGLPWENRELWERLSPFNAVEKITTPTLVMGGALDWNVPVQNSEQLYQALRRLGRTTELVVYPGEHHGIRRPSFQQDRLERYLAWYDRHVARR
ncbi:MAG TPA: S9 family peptidase [Thermoanaerobaculia bacterium]|nr:S9 family peptidase [Thermoanaerobaculia bacterium]